MQFQVKLILVYIEPFPRRIEDGCPPLAIDELRTIAAAPSIEANINDKPTSLSLLVLTFEEALAQGYSWSRQIFKHEKGYLAVFEGVVLYDLDALAAGLRKDNGEKVELSSENLEELAASLVKSDLDKFAGDLALASTIALPGALYPDEIQYVINGEQHIRMIGPDVIRDVREDFAKTDWPPFVHLPLKQTLAWLRRIPGFEDGFPTGNLGRAVAALSHVLGYGNSESAGPSLMWAMIGLEALYTRGREGLSEQLREKVQVLLGSPELDVKRFKGLYVYRSKFIHGGLDIPLNYTPYDGLDAFTEAVLDTYHAELIATAILLATLQKMVIDDKSDLDFFWVLKPKDPNKEL